MEGSTLPSLREHPSYIQYIHSAVQPSLSLLSTPFKLISFAHLKLVTTHNYSQRNTWKNNPWLLCMLMFSLVCASCVSHALYSQHFIILKWKPRPVIPALRGSEKTNRLILLVCLDSCVPEHHLCLGPSAGPGVWDHWRQPTPLSRKAIWTEDIFLLWLVILFLKYYRPDPRPLRSLTPV